MALIIDDKFQTRHSIMHGAYPIAMSFYGQVPGDTDRGTKAANGSLAVVISQDGQSAVLAIKSGGTWYDLTTDLEVILPT
jgi:hypothetical protein